MSNKLSPREKQLLDARGLEFRVMVYAVDASTQLYSLNDGHKPDRMNTIRARSPIHAIDKINRRYINEFRQLNFRLKQSQERAAWQQARNPLKAAYHHRHEDYWSKRIKDHEQRFDHFSRQWPAHKPPVAIDADELGIDLSLTEFPDPEDFDIEDGQ